METRKQVFPHLFIFMTLAMPGVTMKSVLTNARSREEFWLHAKSLVPYPQRSARRDLSLAGWQRLEQHELHCSLAGAEPSSRATHARRLGVRGVENRKTKNKKNMSMPTQ